MLHIYYDICNENTVSCFTEKAQWTRYRTIRIYLTQLHKSLSHVAALTLRLHDVLFQSAGKSHGNLPFFLKVAMSRRSHCLSMAISRRPWRFYGAPWRSFGVLVGNFVALSRHFHCGVYRVVTARALRVHGPASAEMRIGKQLPCLMVPSPRVLCDLATFNGDVTMLPRRCLRFHGAQVGVLDCFRMPWERRPDVTATILLNTVQLLAICCLSSFYMCIVTEASLIVLIK